MKPHREQFNMPPRLFLYTLDQLSMMLQIEIKNLKTNYLHYDQRSVGARPGSKMVARNIAPDGEKPDWRVAENEVIRYMRKHGFRIYNRTTLSS